MELENLYQEVILDHYKRPKNKGLRPNSMVQVHHVNTSCGDEITLNLSLRDGRVSDLSWDGVGCSISQASASVMSELLKGKTRLEASELLGEFQEMLQSKGLIQGDESRLEDGVAFAGVAKFPARVKCALLAWMAYKDAVSRIGDKHD
ncbi:MAG: Fe-S cluster assembly sulfur transfer protein SufU [Candidatus Nanopelagicaceae bacterium]